jgi:hypothetical protein
MMMINQRNERSSDDDNDNNVNGNSNDIKMRHNIALTLL